MKRFKLSNSEEILMDTLWRENRPLTTLQLAEKVTEARWNTNYIDKLLGQLVKKGMVQVSGLLQNGRYQSRQFVPCYTKDEFLANMLEEQGVNRHCLPESPWRCSKNLPNQTNPSRKKS